MNKVCNFCGNKNFVERKVQYIYKYDDKLLIVNNVPCEECQYCGEQYFKADVLKSVEAAYKKIYIAGKRAELEIRVPVEEFAPA